MIISLSGGADSATLLAYASKEMPTEKIQPVIFMYGQRHSRELECSRMLASYYRSRNHNILPVIKLSIPLISKGSALTDTSQEVPPLREVVGHPQPPTYVPFRNLIFSSFCLHLAESLNHSTIGLGVHKSDTYGYWDTSVDFILALETIASLNRQVKIRAWCPFLNKTKADIIHLGLQLDVPYHWTWSCYRGGEKPCHECATCREREAAFESCGQVDPLLSQSDESA